MVQGGKMEKLIRIGIGGPVGAGKSHLLLRLCEALRAEKELIVITNDIYTREDAQFLTRKEALDTGRIMGVETGGCPHAAVRDDISLNMDALKLLSKKFPEAEIAFIESGGDNLSATFSPDLVDFQIYVIDVAQGDDIPRKGGMGIARSDYLVVNKTDLAPYVDVDLDQMRQDLQAVRGPLATTFTNLKAGEGVEAVKEWILGLKKEEGAALPLWSGNPTLKSAILEDHHHGPGGHHHDGDHHHHHHGHAHSHKH
jgi:urease accessory protein